MTDNGYTNSTVLFAFIAGAASGAVVALLLAPKSGRETRADLQRFGTACVHTAAQVPSAMRAAYDSASAAAVDAFNDTLQASSGGNGPAHSAHA